MSVRTKSIRFGWALQWNSQNLVDGKTQYIMANPFPSTSPYNHPLFHTRKEARAHREESCGYIRQRPDLRKEPHGWKLPKVVKVKVVISECL